LGPMPHLNPLITPYTEMEHREQMTINAFAYFSLISFADCLSICLHVKSALWVPQIVFSYPMI
jgi:hypothetical protein